MYYLVVFVEEEKKENENDNEKDENKNNENDNEKDENKNKKEKSGSYFMFKHDVWDQKHSSVFFFFNLLTMHKFS